MPLPFKDLLVVTADEGLMLIGGHRWVDSFAPENTSVHASEEALALKHCSIAGFPQRMPFSERVA